MAHPGRPGERRSGGRADAVDDRRHTGVGIEHLRRRLTRLVVAMRSTGVAARRPTRSTPNGWRPARTGDVARVERQAAPGRTLPPAAGKFAFRSDAAARDHHHAGSRDRPAAPPDRRRLPQPRADVVARRRVDRHLQQPRRRLPGVVDAARGNRPASHRRGVLERPLLVPRRHHAVCWRGQRLALGGDSVAAPRSRLDIRSNGLDRGRGTHPGLRGHRLVSRRSAPSRNFQLPAPVLHLRRRRR